MSANWLRRASVQAWISLRTTFHDKMLFQLTRNDSCKCSCLDLLIQRCCRRSTRFAPFVSADKFFPFLKSCGKILQFAPIWNQDLSQKSSSFSSTQRIPNDGPNVARPQAMMVLLQEHYRSFHFLSQPKVQRGRSFPEHRQLVLHPTELIECFVRDNVVLIFHPLNHCPEA